MPERIAILCSDLHLSDKPPVARCGEPDWYEAMARPLRELRDLAGDLPVFCGGDVFDKWKSVPKLINFAMRELPPFFYSVMGQHDMPYHNWEERWSSAFWTLVEGGKVRVLSKGNVVRDILVNGFHWGEDLRPSMLDGDPVKLAVAHKYCWKAKSRDEAVATEQNKLDVYIRSLGGFNVALFGDNHKGFSCVIDANEDTELTIFNAGTFMRRRTDEKDYNPMVGILHEDGSVEKHFLDTSKDVMSDSSQVQSAEKMMIQMDGFVEELRTMQDSGLRFETAIERALEEGGVGKLVRQIVLEAMEGK